LNTQSAFGAKVATRDTSQKKIVPDVAICGSVTVREHFRKKKKEVWQHAIALPKKNRSRPVFIFIVALVRMT